MEKESTEQFGVEQYIASGGRWDEETFDVAMQILAVKEDYSLSERRWFLERTRLMSEYSGVIITEEEAILFGVLVKNPIIERLSDQRLLAEVILLMGNIEKRRVFESKYPQINFSNPVGV